MDAMLLAKAIKDLAAADKSVVECVIKIGQRAEKAADEAEKVARKRGLRAQAVPATRKDILGVAV